MARMAAFTLPHCDVHALGSQMRGMRLATTLPSHGGVVLSCLSSLLLSSANVPLTRR